MNTPGWQRYRRIMFCLVALLAAATAPERLIPAVSGGESSPSEIPAFTADDFAQKVEPILNAHCVGCHGADVQENQLRLDSLAGFSAGGKAGPVIVPGAPDDSPLVSAIRYRDEALQMPPDEKLTSEQIDVLVAWVAAGAPHPAGKIVYTEPVPNFDVTAARKFWAFQSPARPVVPEVQHPQFVSSPIDAFIVSALEAQHLTPADVADKRTLIRRATFDLIGLPPAPEEIAAFLADESGAAFSTVIERLLDSPHYGERWGRHWLDVVRYADSNGLDENIAHGNAYRYRDYVISSFNRDKPYDQFLKEQVAGDLLAAAEADDAVRRELLTATGFLALGPKVLAEADQTKMLMDIIDEQIDTTGRAFLGLTFGCARCHDHKFDPISQADYYSMVGIFKSTCTMESLKTIARWHENSIATTADQQALQQHQSRLDATKAEIAQVTAAATSQNGAGGTATAEDQFPEDIRQRLAQLREQQKQLEASVPQLPSAMGVREGTAERARINIRGSHLTLGRSVARGIPVVLQPGRPLEISESESGRMQLAGWLADPRNPLVARVMVNRVWRWHFGRAIVASTDNFGHLGERPGNLPLLDWLAAEFISSGYSLKALHRTIMLSRTWQLSSEDTAAGPEIDPGNLLHWRASVRRLEAEALRDAVLCVSGLLDRRMQGSMLHVANREFLFNHTSKDETRYDSTRRSVYLPVIRNHQYDGFSLFDCTDAAVPNGDRATSTVASQALFMMNSELLLSAAEALAKNLLSQATSDSTARIQLLYQRCLGRPATAEEVAQLEQVSQSLPSQLLAEGAAEADLQTAVWSVICQCVLASNEFVYVR